MLREYGGKSLDTAEVVQSHGDAQGTPRTCEDSPQVTCAGPVKGTRYVTLGDDQWRRHVFFFSAGDGVSSTDCSSKGSCMLIFIQAFLS